MFPFKVVNKESKPCIEVDSKEGKKVFQAEEISAMVLVKMKETAEGYLGKQIKNAVVTVPGIFFFRSRYRLSLLFFLSIFQRCTASSNKRCGDNRGTQRCKNYQ
jgi:molecular chaperone DnaK (HSP70)